MTDDQFRQLMDAIYYLAWCVKMGAVCVLVGLFIIWLRLFIESVEK